ncbi:MAG: phage terminase large subunit, partial [Planctomycetes bacterium]|nr:phage terminase large subunit [Planctomycetota bacterium]
SETAKADGSACTVLIEQEPGSGGIAQVNALVRQLAGFRVRGVRVTGDKVVRAGPVASQAQAGNIRLLQGPWIGPFLDELEGFPQGGMSDMVDALSMAFNELHVAPQPRVTVI